MDGSLAAVNRIVERVRVARHLDRATVEQIVEAKLKRTSTTRYTLTSEAKDVRAGPLELNVELREPVPNSGAEAGSLLVVYIISGCPARQDVAARYKPWTLSDVPRGRSLDEQTSWSREEHWGELSFGFAEAAPDCLRSISFDTKA